MRNLLFFVAAAVSTAAAAEPAPVTFTHQGETYTYRVSDTGEGRQVIYGKRQSDGERFRYVVTADRVTGTAGKTPVSFRRRDVRDEATLQVAAR